MNHGRRPHTFIVRILHDEDGETLHGQVSDPTAANGWHATFSSATELWGMLTERMGVAAKTAMPQAPQDSETSED